MLLRFPVSLSVLIFLSLACLATELSMSTQASAASTADKKLSWLYTPIPVPEEGSEDIFVKNVWQAIQAAPKKYQQELLETIQLIAYAKICYESEVQGIQKDFDTMNGSDFMAAGFLAVYKMARTEKNFSLAYIVAMGNEISKSYPKWHQEFIELLKNTPTQK